MTVSVILFIIVLSGMSLLACYKIQAKYHLLAGSTILEAAAHSSFLSPLNVPHMSLLDSWLALLYITIRSFRERAWPLVRYNSPQDNDLILPPLALWPEETGNW